MIDIIVVFFSNVSKNVVLGQTTFSKSRISQIRVSMYIGSSLNIGNKRSVKCSGVVRLSGAGYQTQKSRQSNPISIRYILIEQ